MVGTTISHYKVLEKIGQKFINLKYELGLKHTSSDPQRRIINPTAAVVWGYVQSVLLITPLLTAQPPFNSN